MEINHRYRDTALKKYGVKPCLCASVVKAHQIRPPVNTTLDGEGFFYWLLATDYFLLTIPRRLFILSGQAGS